MRRWRLAPGAAKIKLIIGYAIYGIVLKILFYGNCKDNSFKGFVRIHTVIQLASLSFGEYGPSLTSISFQLDLGLLRVFKLG